MHPFVPMVASLVLGPGMTAQSPQRDPAPPRDLAALLEAEPAKFGAVLAAARAHRVQISLAEPETDASGRVVLRRSTFGDPRQYFYPASSVKLAAAVAALLELQRLSAVHGVALGLDTEWSFASRFPGDDSLQLGPLTVRQDLDRLLFASDNPAFNHCFDCVGPRRLNETLWSAGFDSSRVWHRLSEARTPSENQQTRAMTLRAGGEELRVPARDDPVDLANDEFADLDIGRAWMRGGERVDEPMSFARKNAISLRDLQDLLVEVVRPDIDTGNRGFPELGVTNRLFLVELLGRLPRGAGSESGPADPSESHGKFVLPGVRRVVPAAHLRVYDKTGRAYGHSIENAYVEDTRTGRGFFLAAVVYTNPNGVLNDDDYAYAEVADPFLADLGEVLARAVFGDPR